MTETRSALDSDPMLREIISRCMAPGGPDKLELTLITDGGYITGKVSHPAEFVRDIVERTQWDDPDRDEYEPQAESAPRRADFPQASVVTQIYLTDAVVRPLHLAAPHMWDGVPMVVQLSHVIGWTFGGMELLGSLEDGGGVTMRYRFDAEGQVARVLLSSAPWLADGGRSI